ncbi:Sak4-like ssDNA annealing protein [Escherichia phage Shy]|uniref:AAA domain protein n=1 Tax=Escherichia phage Halfdan TaxID=2234092 RepID=A0A2Z5H483_9CAUD|nr:AAA domain protein [Escherichia phage Halfdan]AXC34302.1 AAA domain protein [Escherichia phage Halfdan]WQZ00308.1 Sak4-like ssDNA annealing protein [Escherichia phage Shy]
MQTRDLRPAGDFARQYGVKMLAYGPPGSGKTPLINTAPRPVLLITEPGMLSMRGSTVPAWEAPTVERIDEFFDWLFRSNESKGFDTVGVDSVSQLAEIVVKAELKRNRDGRKAYGEMARKVLDHLTGLYYMQQKHTYLIAKQAMAEEEGTQVKKPYFPGQELGIQVPHLYDLIGHVAKTTVPGVQSQVLAIRTAPTFGINAPRDRSGRLNELEQPDLTALFKKAMS